MVGFQSVFFFSSGDIAQFRPPDKQMPLPLNCLFFLWHYSLDLDSITYLISAYLMYLVGGTRNVAEQADKSLKSLWAQLKGMTGDVFDYLRGSFFGPLVLLKASGGIIYGGGDVLSVTFSEPNGMNDKNSPLLLGILFASVGVGCTIG